jgi:L-lactate utilization protein LutB
MLIYEVVDSDSDRVLSCIHLVACLLSCSAYKRYTVLTMYGWHAYSSSSTGIGNAC